MFKHYNTKIETPYFDLYTNELDDDFLSLIKEFTMTFTRPNIKAKNRAKTRKTMQEYIYYYIATEATEQNTSKIKDIDKRGVNFVLDHIIPLDYGFKNNIDINIISSENNLQLLSNKDNLLKSNKITPQVLSKIKELGITPNKPIDNHPYKYYIQELSKHKEHNKRLSEGMLLKVITRTNGIVDVQSFL